MHRLKTGNHLRPKLSMSATARRMFQMPCPAAPITKTKSNIRPYGLTAIAARAPLVQELCSVNSGDDRDGDHADDDKKTPLGIETDPGETSHPSVPRCIDGRVTRGVDHLGDCFFYLVIHPLIATALL